jgi:uncharacterized membrane protein (DUF106 family)
MVRIEKKVTDLIIRDAGIVESIQVILNKSNNGEKEIDWLDVKGEITSGHWGRLIENGILKEGNKGFLVDDASLVKETIENFGGARKKKPEADESTKWTKWDKSAAVIAVGLFAGYSFAGVREVIGSVIDIIIGPIDELLPFYMVIMILAMFTGLYSTLLQANLMDMDKMSEYQAEMKEIQAKQKLAQEGGNKEEIERVREEQMEAMGDQIGLFKLQFRPMVWIMIFTIPVFLWIYWKILTGNIDSSEMEIIIPFAGKTSWTDGILGPLQLWILWYFMSSMAFTQVIRKALGIQTTGA